VPLVNNMIEEKQYLGCMQPVCKGGYRLVGSPGHQGAPAIQLCLLPRRKRGPVGHIQHLKVHNTSVHSAVSHISIHVQQQLGYSRLAEGLAIGLQMQVVPETLIAQLKSSSSDYCQLAKSHASMSN